MPKKITKAQRLQLDRLKASVRSEQIADNLKQHKLLWDAFVFGRSGRYGVGELIELRDLSDGFVNADEILLVTDKERWHQLLPIIESWEPQEIGYTSGDGQLWGIPAYQSGKEIEDAMGCTPVHKSLLLVRIWWN